MSTQQIFAQEPQAPFGFAENPQPTIAFPLSLAEKYQPRQLSDLVGLEGPLRLLNTLVQAPRACAMLFVGNPGVGKTIAGLCFADTLGGSLVHISAQKCDVATLDSLRDRFAYHPPKGKFWVCLVDEADQMTEKAQVQLLSRLDATASLVIGFGGASTRQSQPPIIWIFTANGSGPRGTVPPTSLAKRFLSRCMVIPFEPLAEDALSRYLRFVWIKEAVSLDAEPAYFDFLACGGEIRESLMKMQVDILTGAPRPVPPAEPEPEPEPEPVKKRESTPPERRHMPGWRRIYGGATERVDRIKHHLAAHKIETIVRDVRTGDRPSARQSILVRQDSYSHAMSLVSRMRT
jgi:ATPase family associated with various cellular activities (AAA)